MSAFVVFSRVFGLRVSFIMHNRFMRNRWTAIVCFEQASLEPSEGFEGP